MRIVLVAHGYPPELVGGTELAVRALARGLAARGHRVLVVAGSLDHAAGERVSRDEDRDPASGAVVRVARLHRADLYFDHWQKTSSGFAARAFEELLDEERPDLVHVHHWIRLTDDLVARAAVRGVPACATLHDLWSSCLIAFRVRPGTHEACTAPLAPEPCLACAAGVPPRTPWLDAPEQVERLRERRATLARELSLARAVIAPTAAHAVAVAGFLGLDEEALRLRVVPHGRDLAFAPRAPLPPPGTHGRLELGSWGHLLPLKGQDLLLAALALLPEPRAVRLHLAGGEPDREFARSLRARARDLDVVFHGPYAVEELDRHPATDVHAMVSGSRAHESWGLVVDEALALRLPLVLPRAGAFAERVRSGALFYERGDAAGLAAVLRTLLADPALLARLRADLPPLAAVVPGVEAHVEALLAVYGEAVAAGAPRVEDTLAEPGASDRRNAAWDAALARTPAAALGLAPEAGEGADGA